MRIELSAPRDLIGFSQYSGYLHSFFSSGWPYGKLLGALRWDGASPLEPAQDARMALALLANGRSEEALRFLARARAAAPKDTHVQLAGRVAELLLAPADDRALRVADAAPGPQLDAATARRVAQEMERVRQAAHAQRWGDALAAIERIPSPLRLRSGAPTRALYGQLLYLAADGDSALLRDAVHHLEDLVREEETYTEAHPEVYYYLARALYALASYDRALRNMRSYVERARAGAPELATLQ